MQRSQRSLKVYEKTTANALLNKREAFTGGGEGSFKGGVVPTGKQGFDFWHDGNDSPMPWNVWIRNGVPDNVKKSKHPEFLELVWDTRAVARACHVPSPLGRAQIDLVLAGINWDRQDATGLSSESRGRKGIVLFTDWQGPEGESAVTLPAGITFVAVDGTPVEDMEYKRALGLLQASEERLVSYRPLADAPEGALLSARLPSGDLRSLGMVLVPAEDHKYDCGEVLRGVSITPAQLKAIRKSAHVTASSMRKDQHGVGTKKNKT